MRTVAIALLSISLLVARADAAPLTGEEKLQARRLYESATRKYDTGRFDDASVDFQKAYDLTGDPALLFNIAQSHRLAGHAEKALFFYRSYLRREPTARRGEIEQWIAELTEQVRRTQETAKTMPPSTPIEQAEPPKPSEPRTTTSPTTTNSTAASTTGGTEAPRTTTPATERPSGRGLKRASYALFAIGAAGLIAGGALSGVAVAQSQKVEQAVRGEFTPELRDAESLGQGAQTGAIAAYAVGGAAVVTAAALLAVGVKRDRAAPEAVRVGFSGAAFTVAGAF